MINFSETLTRVYSKRYVGKLTKWLCTTWKNGTVNCFQNWHLFLDMDSSQLLEEFFWITLFWNFLYGNILKDRLRSDSYFEGYPLFTISCGRSDDIQKNASRSCRYDNYTLPNQFLRTLTMPFLRVVQNRFWWIQQGCPSGQEWGWRGLSRMFD